MADTVSMSTGLRLTRTHLMGNAHPRKASSTNYLISLRLKRARPQLKSVTTSNSPTSPASQCQILTILTQKSNSKASDRITIIEMSYLNTHILFCFYRLASFQPLMSVSCVGVHYPVGGCALTFACPRVEAQDKMRLPLMALARHVKLLVVRHLGDSGTATWHCE
jgi:hypothetical protein